MNTWLAILQTVDLQKCASSKVNPGLQLLLSLF